MITKSAFFPRLLPGVLAARPTAAVAGYWMPRERYLAYGIGFSALLHAAVLLGFNPPKPPIETVAITAGDSIARVWKEAVLVAEPPPVPVATVVKPTTPADGAAANDAGTTRASIPDHIIDIEPGAIVVAGGFEHGIEPDAKRLVWTPPLGGAGLGNRNGVPLVNEDDLDTKPVATTRAAPNYPSEAKRLGLSGTVLLRFIVDHRGNVAEVEVVNADHSEFVRASAEAMARWRFSPGRKNGRAVNTIIEMPMRFTLGTAT